MQTTLSMSLSSRTEKLAAMEPAKWVGELDEDNESDSDPALFSTLETNGEFRMRVCIRFVKDTRVSEQLHNLRSRKFDGPFCVCGRRKKYHYDIAHSAIGQSELVSEADGQSEREWSYLTDTRLVATNASGQIFSLRYLRLDCDTHLATCRKSLERQFPMLTSFDFIVTLLGDSVNPLRSRQKMHLRALLSTVQAYNGLCLGELGSFRALRRVVTSELGLSSWVSVFNWSLVDLDTREELVLASGGDRRLAESPSVLDAEDRSNSDNLLDERDFLLDCRGGVLLVDDGKLGRTYEHTYMVDYCFRSRLENELSAFASALDATQGDTLLKPSCYVLFGGDQHSLRQLRSAFQLRGVPFVVLRGSGRMADIVALILTRFATDSASARSAEKLLTLAVLRNLIDFPVSHRFEVLDGIRQDLVALVRTVADRRISPDHLVFPSNALDVNLFDYVLKAMLAYPRSVELSTEYEPSVELRSSSSPISSSSISFSVESYPIVCTAFRRGDASRVRLIIESLTPCKFQSLVTRKHFLEAVLFNMPRFENCAFNKLYTDTNESIGMPLCCAECACASTCCLPPASRSAVTDPESIQLTATNPKNEEGTVTSARTRTVCPLSRVESVLYDLADFPIRCPLCLPQYQHMLYRRVEPITCFSAPLRYGLRKLGCCMRLATCACFVEVAQTQYDTSYFFVVLWCVFTHRADVACVLLTLTDYCDRLATLAFSCNLLRTLKERDTRADAVKRVDETVTKLERALERQLSDGAAANKDACNFSILHDQAKFDDRSVMAMIVNRYYSKLLDNPAVVSLMDQIWGCNVSSTNHTLLAVLCIFIPLLVPFVVRFRINRTQSLFDDNYLCGKVQSCLSINQEELETFDEKTLVQIVHTAAKQRNGKDAQNACRNRCSLTCAFLRLLLPFIFAFYYSPRVTYILNCLVTVTFLITFSVFVVSETVPVNFTNSYLQICLTIYVGSLLLEELRILLMHKADGLWRRITWYFEVSTLSRPISYVLLFALGMALINIYPSSSILVIDLFEFGKITLIISLILAYAQSLSMFATNETIGTTFIMIKKLMRRFGALFLILLFVVLAYTVASVTLMNRIFDQDSSIFTVLDMIRYAVLSVFDMTDMDDALKTCAVTQFRFANSSYSNTSSAALKTTCTKRSSAALSALITGKEVTVKLLLVQLVIPIFMKELDKYENLHERWRRKMYELVEDYLTKPPLVPPLIILCHVMLVIDWLLSLCCSCIRKCRFYKSVFFLFFGRNVDFKMAFADADYVSIIPAHTDVQDDVDDAQKANRSDCVDPKAPPAFVAFNGTMAKKYSQFVNGLLTQADAQSDPCVCDEETMLNLQKELKTVREDLQKLQKLGRTSFSTTATQSE